MRILAALLVVPLAVIAAATQAPSAVDDAFQKFFAAASPAEAERLVDAVLATRVGFDDAYARLKRGRPYAEIPDSDMAYRWKHSTGVTFRNVVEVPDGYDPSRPWPARVQLHGGIGRPAPQDPRQAPGRPRGGASIANRIAGEEQFYVYPSGWMDAEWWDAEGVDNILRLIDVVKRRYNIDENRVYLTGISDGGTGVYYLAMKAPTPWASYLPLNGMLGVLRNPDTGASGELYGNNLVNAPLYVVNGENDPLYPVSAVRPYVTWMEKMGVPLVFRPQAGAGHNTAWWPIERAPFEAFVHEHPRVPHPERLTWETERTDRFNRIRWLAIDRIRPGGSKDTHLEDTDIFRHVKPSGRVDVRRTGNTFEALTRGVSAFTLLLSPDVVDFSKPVLVTVNGRPLFKGTVKKDVATLLTWAARDNDRTMLYGAELEIAVP
jgi:predicted esterase